MMRVITTNVLSAIGSCVEFVAQTGEHRERNVHVRRVRAPKGKSGSSEHAHDGGNADMWQPQMGDQEQLQENREDDITTQEITTFVDDHTRHETGEGFDAYKVYDPMPAVALEEFIKRPILIARLNWTSADVLGVSKGNWVFPDIFTNNSSIRQKLEKVAFWRPTFELTIRVNGTPMHYGKMIFAWIPQARALNNAYYNSYFSAFSNRWVQVSASANQATAVTIPYTHYKETMSVGLQDMDLFTLYAFVSSPLTSVNGAAPSINLSIYARVIEPNLMGYNYGNDWVAQMAGEKPRVRSVKGKSEDEVKTDDGKVVSNSVKSLAGTVSKFKWLPVVGEFAEPIASGISMFGNLLSFFGLSTPINLETTQPMQVRQPRYYQSEDTVTSLTLGQKAAMTVSKDYAMVNDSLESSSILRFVQRPALIYVGQITSATPAAAIIHNQYVTPTSSFCGDYVNGTPTTEFVVSPLFWMSKYFGLWRGGIRYHVSFIASHFHSLRVRIWYMPYFPASAYGANYPGPTDITSEDMINVVLDINKETDFSFTVPYCQQSEWLCVQGVPRTVAGGQNYYYNNGVWGMTILNPLTSGAATVTAINFHVYESAAADYQLACPTMQNVDTTGFFSPQMDDFQPQSDFDVLECEIPSSSMQCLMEKEYPPLGNIARGRINSETFVSMETTSVKQLTNMLSTFTTTTGNTTAPNGFNILPGGFMDSNNTDGRRCNWLVAMSTVFRYNRGGIRLALRCIDPDAVAQTNTGFITGTQAFAFFGATIITGDQNTWTQTTVFDKGQNSSQFSKLTISPVDVTVPYFNYYKCYATNMHTAIAALDDWPTVYATLLIYSPLGSPVGWFLGGADDFILGYQLGIPQQTMVLPP